MPFPTQPAELTAAWLTSILRHHAPMRAHSPIDEPAMNRAPTENGVNAEGITVKQVTVTPLVEAKGFYGQVVRLQLDYANTELRACGHARDFDRQVCRGQGRDAPAVDCGL